MRLRHIEVFHAVYVTGSVSAGARALNVSQPTVSKVLKHAEDQLGFSLFDRIGGRLIPTEKGQKLFVEIEPVFEKLRDLDKFTHILANTRSGHLRFAATPAFGLEIVPQSVAAYMKAHPDVTIEVETVHARQLVQALQNNEIDIGLVFDAPHVPGISSHRLKTTEFICVASKDMRLPNRKVLTLEQLVEYPLITLNQKSVLGQTLSRKLSDAGGRAPNSQITVETYHIAKRLVQQRAGLAIIDAITGFSGDNTGLQFRQIDPRIHIGIDVITRLDAPKERYHEEFMAALEESITLFCRRTSYTKHVKSSVDMHNI